MKKYLIILIVFLASCQKEEEPKSLVVTNEINQMSYSRYDTSTFVEDILIMYYNSEGKRVRSDVFPTSYSTVKTLSSYQVTSTELPDNISSIYVLVRFYYTGNKVSIINYESEEISIHEGINTYTITDSDLKDY